MTLSRLGWGILLLVVAAVALVASMIRIVPAGSGAAMPVPPAAPVARVPPGSVGALRVPVVGVARGSLHSNWGDERGGGTRHHAGLDILAAGGTPVIAAAPGVVEKVWHSAAGGNTLYVRSPDRAWTYYYAHLASYAPGIVEGRRLKAGQQLGFVGDTGNAGPGNFHLHFGMTRTTPAERWYQGQPVDPYPLLAGDR